MADNGGNLRDDDWMRREGPHQNRRLVLIAGGLFAVLVVFVLIYAVWGPNSGPVHPAGLPVITAPDGPDRVEPEDPGGLNVPHRDKLVYDRITGEQKSRVEHLLPDAEQPMSRDQIAELIEQDQTDAEKATTSGTETQMAAAEPQTEPEAVAAPAPTPTPKPTAKPAPKPAAKATTDNGPKIRRSDWLLQLAAFRTLEGAQTAWARLKKNKADLLGDLSADYQKVDIKGQGSFHRLRVGPFADKASATKRCDRLKAANQDCLLIAPR